MSLRQFYPRKNLRRQVASWKLFILYATLLVAIGLQISYPLINGEPLRVVTIATVYWAAAAMFFHASIAYGFVYSLQFLLLHLATHLWWNKSVAEVVGHLEVMSTPLPWVIKYMVFH